MGRTLIVFGAVLVVTGVGVLLWERFGLPPRLPGDVVLRRGPVTFYFPIVTSLVLSLVLTVLLNLILRRR